MTFTADFHVHSCFSRATAKNLDLEHLHIAAQLKGITVVGTGDATHPGWFAEIKKKLMPVGDGLFRLNDSLRSACEKEVPTRCHAEVRFILVSEISNIYKKNGKTRKNHNLVFLPTLEAAEQFNRRLDQIGNIRSDGRPILGLDARDLLEILLETDDRAFLIPAHIWTPWFSLLGSKSGFDSLEECFEDLSGHIFAVETGLSSDPAMNRLVSSLDHLTLVSNSDAHSPSKLAREANIFHCEPGYAAIRAALEQPQSGQFGGTLEFYPEEGKYHLDGHRKCAVRLTPEETRDVNGMCPVCGRALTVGVFNRVQFLADRTAENIPAGQPPFESLIPLSEILSELLQVGPATKTVGRAYALALASLGNELHILRDIPPEKIDTIGIPLLGEAIHRMRSGKVAISPGYDGEYGRIRVFSDSEKNALLGQRRLFPGATARRASRAAEPPHRKPRTDGIHPPMEEGPRNVPSPVEASVTQAASANQDQQQAIGHGDGPLLIVAGPGTGKTRTLTHRMAHLIQERGISAEGMLAVTFTEKAAREMQTRLSQLLDDGAPRPLATTFHALCWMLIREEAAETPWRIIDDEDRLLMLQRIGRRSDQEGHTVTLTPRVILQRIVDAKQKLQGPEAYFESVAPETPASQFARAYTAYQNLLEDQHLLDFEDLIFKVARRLETDDIYRKACRERFPYVFVDEYQDLNYGQYRLIRYLVPPSGNLCVIGDPDQAIYGFRGSDVTFFNRFVEDYPDTRVIHLTRNYRSTETILEASWQVIRHRETQASGLGVIGSRLYSQRNGVPQLAVVELPSEKAEAVAVGLTIERAVGGAGFLAIDAGKVDTSSKHDYSFADFAVLYRTAAQADILADVFTQAGIPFQRASRQKFFTHPPFAALLSVIRIMARMGSANDLNRLAGFLQPTFGKDTLDAFLDGMETRGMTLHQALEQAPRDNFQDLSPSRRRRLAEALDDLKALITGLIPLSLEDRIMHLARRWTTDDEGDPLAVWERDAVVTLVAHARRCQEDSARFLASLMLQTDADMVQSRVEKVTFATMHAAKGLEFPVVFIVGCEDGLIPMGRDGERDSDREEERRLFYVALTRAREQLYLTWSRKRRIYGRREARDLSPFVGDIERKLLKHQAPQHPGTHQVQQVQLKLF